MIVITPTYYQDNEEKGNTVQDEDYFLTANFHNELVNDLISAVESTYHTYAQTAGAKRFQNSRNHRFLVDFQWVQSRHGIHFYRI